MVKQYAISNITFCSTLTQGIKASGHGRAKLTVQLFMCACACASLISIYEDIL